MKIQATPVTGAIAALLFGLAASAQAQTPAPSSDAKLEAVVVTGIRASQQKSLTQKKNAESHVDVITAEDIGKMPDKNIADSLQRVPGITISSAGANEGGFDENDRVSMRGTNPSLTQTLINGHNLASGDWFVLNQTTNAGRSVSYTLLPSEIVGSVVVHKTSEASLVEGGLTGSVNIITRKPLEFRKGFTAEVQLGAVYASLPKKTDPQFSALFNWKNPEQDLGVLLQVFSEKRSLRRDGLEVLGYNQIAAGSKVALSNPDLAGVWYPRSIGAALFEQERKREGGLIEVQFKPNSDTSLSLTGYTSTLNATNYNRNYLLHAPFFLDEGKGQAPAPGYVVRNNTLVSATFPAQGGFYGTYDMISRPGAKAKTDFIAFDGKFKLSDSLSLNAKAGTSDGLGSTPTQDVMAMDQRGGGSWALNGVSTAPSFSIGTPSNTNRNSALDWVWGAQNVKVDDRERWGQLDGNYAFDGGLLRELKFGVRTSSHDRSSANVIAQGPKCSDGSAFTWGATWCTNPATSPDANAVLPSFQNYPSNFGSGLGGTFPRDVWYYTPAQLAEFNNKFANRDPVSRRYFDWEYALKEKTQAAYTQLNFGDSNALSGNVGLRLVRTEQSTLQYLPAIDGAADVSSAFGGYDRFTTKKSFNDTLPSLNLRYALNRETVLRGAITRTMTRPDYSALAGATNISPVAKPGDIGSGSSSNPDLKPVRSTNFDVAFEYYPSPRAMMGVSAFYMDLDSLITLGQTKRRFKTTNAAFPNGFDADYVLTTPVNGKGKVKGVELSLEQPLGANFGVQANYTHTDAEEEGGKPMLGASKNSYTLGAYYEDSTWNARVTYSYRSAFYSGLDRATAFSQDAAGSLSASLGYQINENLALSLDGRNLNNPKLKYYALNKDQPRSIYENGRQFYLTLRAKL